MVRHAALDAEAECADLARPRAVRVAPAAGWPSRRRGRRRRSAAQVATSAASSARTSGRTSRPRVARRHDRVGHELARTVVRDLAATLDADHLDAAGGQLVGASPRMWAGSLSARASARRGARAAGAGRRSVRPPARPRGASGAPVPRGTRPGRAMIASIGPGSGVDPLRPGTSVSDRHRRTIAGPHPPAASTRPPAVPGPDGRPEPERQ